MSDSHNGSGLESVYEFLEVSRSSHSRERVDAARNRSAILDAASQLFAEHGVENVSLDAVAARASVGKGTLYRRFGDKSGLAVALLDERERELQQRIMYGEPPLGPGAEAGDRLSAFFAEYLQYALTHLDVLRISETAAPGARYRVGAYQFWHRHITILLEQLGWSDVEGVAHTLLAPLASEHLTAVVEKLGAERVRDSNAEFTAALLRSTETR